MPRDTEIAMLPRQITHQNILRVLFAGFTLVIVLLVAAAIVGIRSIQSIQANADNLVREQSLTNRLIDELHSQQTTLSEVFSVLARDPDSVDYYKIMSQLDEADRDIARISDEGSRTAEHDLWQRLNRSSLEFSHEARRLLSIEEPETFSSIDLFRFHGAFTSVVARLLEAEYRKLNDAQDQIEHRTSHLREISLIFGAASVSAGADLRGRDRAHGVAVDSPVGIADRRVGPRVLAHAWKIRRQPRAVSRTNCTTNSANR